MHGDHQMNDYQQQQQALLLKRWKTTRQLGSPRSASGPHNSISDVAGVRVGHCTLAAGEVQTGVTAIVPPGENLFTQPLPCGAAVLNGFAKPVGLVQIEELGLLQTPILLSNTLATGTLSALTLDGVQMGDAIAPILPELAPQQDAGSIIIIMAMDAPLDARQLKRIAKRAGAGLGRLGSYWGHGSGDIAVAFSTCPQPQPPEDAQLESLLSAAADATEHAVLDAMLQADAVTGFRGHHRPTLPQALDRLAATLYP